MIFPVRLLRFATLFIVVLFSSRVSRANTFNWPTSPAFPTGPTVGHSATQKYAGFGTLTVQNNADPSTGTGGTWQGGYPKVDNSTTTGGNSPAVNGMQLYMASQPTTLSNIQVTMHFNFQGGATNVSLVIWDVDAANNFTDQIANIVGIDINGQRVAATVTGSVDNTVTGSGTFAATATGTASSTNNLDTGNVNISFGAAAIQSITFTWSDVNPTTRTTQVIGVSPIIFTPVGPATPEVGSSLAALVTCLGAVGCGKALRRRKVPAQA